MDLLGTLEDQVAALGETLVAEEAFMMVVISGIKVDT